MWATEYRPSTFEEVIGQDKAIKILKGSVGKSNVFILHGESGIGKTTLARIYASYINGEAIEINGADNNGVDDIRGLVTAASYIPAFNDYKVFIIDECHMLTTQAWNALLKILEESPKSTVWLLCTTDFSKVPATIKSRSTVVKLDNLSVDDITKTLKIIYKKATHNGDVLTGSEIDQIAVWSEGRLREAITQFETYINTGVLNLPMSTGQIISLLIDVFKGDVSSTLKKIDKFSSQDVYALIRFINDYMKLMLLRKQLPPNVSTESILLEYTGISPMHLDQLRSLQEWVWKSAKGTGEQWKLSVDCMYEFYDTIMRHYNDFRDARAAVSIAIMKVMEQNYE